jgi:phytoene dehydrogenase-like protein
MSERSDPTEFDADVLIVGGGLAGLACAHEVTRAGLVPLVLEASDEVGGRARTDLVDGFRFDRGFQVLLTAYPVTQRVLDYGALDLRSFEPGSLIRVDGDFHMVSDPFRRPARTVATLRAPIGSFADKRRIASLSLELRGRSVADILSAREVSTRDRLDELRFSERIIHTFFRPFLGGVFLDPELETSSRMFEFVFKMFGAGPVAVPASGMGALARQLAEGLASGSVRFDSRVARASADGVTLGSGEALRAGAVVLATDWETTCMLGGLPESPAFRPALCWYFESDEPPVDEGVLVLDGEGRGPVTNLAVMSRVSDRYAPPGTELISATVLGETEPSTELLDRIRKQMREWFGGQVDGWRELRHYRIRAALPDQSLRKGGVNPRPNLTADGIHLCGDHRVHGSIEGAIQSGVAAAGRVVAALAGDGLL